MTLKKRTPILLAVIILLPVLLLAWFGVRHQQNQQQLLEHQFSNLIEHRLQTVDQLLQDHFLALQRRLIPDARTLQQQRDGTYSPEPLRQYIKQSPWLSQLFVLTPQGERQFPPSNQQSNRLEQAFVERTKALFATPELFNSPELDPINQPIKRTGQRSQLQSSSAATDQYEDSVLSSTLYSGQLSQQAQPERLESPTQKTDILADNPHGWIAWYADTGLQHIFWWRDDLDNVIGFVLNGPRLVSDLLNRLPEGDSQSSSLGRAEIRLINDRDEVVYAWGEYRPQANSQPQRVLPLSHPIGSWRLAYYAPALQAGDSGWMSLVSWLILLTSGLSALAWLLYREHNREIRNAEQRVNFVNQVSHELKTPLTNVRLYAEMLEQHLPTEEEDPVPQRYLRVIASESQRLSRLIENVLSFSRIKRGGLKISPKQDQIDRCIEQIIENFTPALNDHNLQIRFDGNANEIRLFDCQALEQILNNLISNCEKYAADGRFIDISSWQEAQSSYIRIRDYGPGIAPGESEAIFTPFYRISNKLTDGVSGTGIGLGLARDLARAQDGDLMLETLTDTAADHPLSGASFLLQINTPEDAIPRGDLP
ncbi:MAG: HAMP domain-containing sensor histidine kinase [Motiliproteus sp.]